MNRGAGKNSQERTQKLHRINLPIDEPEGRQVALQFSKSFLERCPVEEMIAWHTKENDTKTAPVIKEAKDMLDEIMGRKPKQLSLF